MGYLNFSLNYHHVEATPTLLNRGQGVTRSSPWFSWLLMVSTPTRSSQSKPSSRSRIRHTKDLVADDG